MGPRPYGFVMQNSVICSVCGFQPSTVIFHAKQRLLAKQGPQITNLYGSQTSPVVLCMQYSVISTRNTCLYGSQPLSVVFACKTACFALEWKVCVGSSYHLWFSACNKSVISTRITSIYGSQPLMCGFWMQNSDFWTGITSLYVSQTSDQSFCACNTAWLVPELLDSKGPSPYVVFLHAKQRLLDQNNKSLWVPDLTCRFVHAKQRD